MADKKPQTDYIVLLNVSEGVWNELGIVTASGAAQAKKKALTLHHQEGGTVAAVPVSSWQPEDLKPKLSFG